VHIYGRGVDVEPLLPSGTRCPPNSGPLATLGGPQLGATRRQGISHGDHQADAPSR